MDEVGHMIPINAHHAFDMITTHMWSYTCERESHTITTNTAFTSVL